MTSDEREGRIAKLKAEIAALKRRTYSHASNARRAEGDVLNWPPPDFQPEVVSCPLCGWAGAVYFTRGAPPAEIHCPSPGVCQARIPIEGGSHAPIRLNASSGWSR